MNPALLAGDRAEEQSDYAEAVAAYVTALAATDPHVVSEAHFRIGRVAWRQGHFREAITGYEQAQSLGVQIGDDEVRARAENGIGAVHYAQGAYVQARASYRVALELSTDDMLRGKITLNLGVITNIEGNLRKARALYVQAAEILERTGDVDGQSCALHNIAMLHADLEEWDEADEAYKRCLDLSERHGKKNRVADVLLNRSELLCARKNFDLAVAHCDRALALYAEIGDGAGRGEALRWKGHALRQMGKLREADTALNAAFRIAGHLHVALLEAESAHEIGLIHTQNGERDSAVTWLRRARDAFKALGAQREVDDVEKELAALGG